VTPARGPATKGYNVTEIDNELAKELEELEEELAKSVDEESATSEAKEVDTEKPTTDEDSQKAESGTEDKSTETQETEDPTPEQKAEESATEGKKLTTLPDDAEAFGEWAGKEVTIEQLQEANLLTKLVTWGHQGRHMVQKGQEDISEAKKLREVIEKQFERENQAADQANAPKVSEEEYANALVEQYAPDIARVVDAGGIEKEFWTDFPKVTAQIENRFQSGSELLTGVIKQIDLLRQIVLPQAEKAELTEAEILFDGKLGELSKAGPLFEKLEEDTVKQGFRDWVTSEDSDLRITEKQVGDITQADLQSAWLLYVHSHPEILKAEEKPETDAHLAGGGGGTASPKAKAPKPNDDLGTFERELAAAVDNQWKED
jgi:hypothetical protein